MFRLVAVLGVELGLTYAVNQLTENFKVFDVASRERGAVVRIDFGVNRLSQFGDQSLVRFRVLEHVVDGPEGETERVVVDVQVDEVVALDVRVGLSVQAHVGDGVLDIVARVVGGQQLVGRRLSQEPTERLHRRREALLRHAEPQVVEVLVEHLEVIVDLLRGERRRRLLAAEDRVEERVEDRLGGEVAESLGRPLFRRVVVVRVHIVAGHVQVVDVARHAALHVRAAHRAARVLDHLLRLDQREVEDVPVDLLLDRVEVEVALLAERLDAVRVHDDRDVLVDEAQREHLPVDGAALVQEVDGVTTEVGRTAPQQAAGDHGRLARSPGAQHVTCHRIDRLVSD